MNVIVKDLFGGILRFFGKKCNRRLLYLFLLGALAALEFTRLGLARRTFVFYAIETGKAVVEDRLLPKSESPETDVTRYVEEALLGPVSPELGPLFPRGTRLQSLLYREGVVYADLSESAVAGIPGGDDLFRSLSALEAGIRRNFSYVKDVRLFIAGNQLRIGKANS
ncbi:MAG: GerMN domain-containing protein [Spirochaetaceae bacterium]|jgi:hypothetical protein|nr:GerMN domain-containing protein [Spirochaetaceae bacterium]